LVFRDIGSRSWQQKGNSGAILRLRSIFSHRTIRHRRAGDQGRSAASACSELNIRAAL
jgi:hypothetical protein